MTRSRARGPPTSPSTAFKGAGRAVVAFATAEERLATMPPNDPGTEQRVHEPESESEIEITGHRRREERHRPERHEHESHHWHRAHGECAGGDDPHTVQE